MIPKVIFKLVPMPVSLREAPLTFLHFVLVHWCLSIFHTQLFGMEKVSEYNAL